MQRRQAHLQQLADALRDSSIRASLTQAYLLDTAFVCSEIDRREILAPAAVLELTAQLQGLIGLGIADLQTRSGIGKVAIVLPKNALGIPMARAVAAAYLTGNETLIRIPRQLTRTEPLYRQLLSETLPGVKFSTPGISAKQFLIESLNDPTVNAIVVYGDDVWIDEYYSLAQQKQKTLIFEGPGNDPLVVLEDADIPAAVAAAIRCGLNNGGQSCSALERFFVHRSVHDRFVECLLERLSSLKIGSPEDPETRLGPIASAKLLQRLQTQIQAAIAQGAELRMGGDTTPSAFQDLSILKPTVLSQCTPEMAIVQEETFGPVFPILSFADVETLIPMLDQSRYGLNASVYGRSPDRLVTYLNRSHRKVYKCSTVVDPDNQSSLMIDGGYKRSGFIWQPTDRGYEQRHGPRYLIAELSQLDVRNVLAQKLAQTFETGGVELK